MGLRSILVTIDVIGRKRNKQRKSRKRSQYHMKCLQKSRRTFLNCSEKNKTDTKPIRFKTRTVILSLKKVIITE